MVNYRKVTLTAMTMIRIIVKGAFLSMLPLAPALLSTSQMLTNKPKKVSQVIVNTDILYYGTNI